MTKFDEDINPLENYVLAVRGSQRGCDCPAGWRPTCRHRMMFDEFVKNQAIDKNLFLDYDNKRWVDPMANAEASKDGQ